MIDRLKQGKLRWYVLKNPSHEEIDMAQKELGFSSILMSDLSTPVPKNLVQRLDDCIKVTVDFPVIKRIDHTHPFEVKFIFNKSNILSVQYEEMEGIDRCKRQFEVSTALKKRQKGPSGASLFLSLLRNLYETADTRLDYVEGKLSEIEDQIFKNNEKKMVFEISDVSKRIITFRHILRSHDAVFRDLRTMLEEDYGTEFSHELIRLQHLYFAMDKRANAQHETLTALRETNAAMLTMKQNEIIKNLTIMAFVTFPLTLFSSMFGMNTENSPIVGHPVDFWIIVSIMIAVALSFFLFFKRQGWM